MKFRLTHASKRFETPVFVDINTIEDIIELDKKTGKNSLVFFSPSSEREEDREIMVYDARLEE